MTDVHPLFSDRPELDELAFAVVHRLHSQVPAEKRPTSWSDFTEAQVLRAKEAAALAYDAGATAAAAKWLQGEIAKAIAAPLEPIRNDAVGRASIERVVGEVIEAAFPNVFRWADHVHVSYGKDRATLWPISDEGVMILSGGHRVETPRLTAAIPEALAERILELEVPLRRFAAVLGGDEGHILDVVHSDDDYLYVGCSHDAPDIIDLNFGDVRRARDALAGKKNEPRRGLTDLTRDR